MNGKDSGQHLRRKVTCFRNWTLHSHCERNMPRRGKWFSIQLPAQDNCDQYDIYFSFFGWIHSPWKMEFPKNSLPNPSWYGLSLVGKSIAAVNLRDYAEVHDEPGPINTISPRNHPEIAVVPSGNFNGTIKFFVWLRGVFWSATTSRGFLYLIELLKNKRMG